MRKPVKPARLAAYAGLLAAIFVAACTVRGADVTMRLGLAAA